MYSIFRPFLKKRFAVLLGVAIVATFGFAHSSLCTPVLAASCSYPAQGTVESSAGQQLAPRYVVYSEAALAEAHKTGNKVVLYFWAPWCSSCTALDIEIEKDPELIPEGIVVLRIDYDKSAELKKKYAVVIQHTFVQVDRAGKAVTQWVGGEPSDLKTKVK